jgi:hypothetical protein
MEKFKKEIELKGSILDFNKYDNFIWCELEGRSGGDWGEYNEGDIVEYDFELLEKDSDDYDLNYIDDYNFDRDDEDKILIEDLKEYVGEGICYVIDYGEDNWYNVKFEGDVMVISFLSMEY